MAKAPPPYAQMPEPENQPQTQMLKRTPKMEKTLTPIVFLALAFMLTLPARAVLVIDCVGSESNIICTTNGSANLTDLTLNSDGFGSNAGLNPLGGQIITGAAGAFDGYSGLTGPTTFGTGTGASLGFVSSSGPLAGIRHTAAEGLQLRLPDNYSSGTQLENSSITYTGTLADVGLVPGSHAWTWGSGANADSMTLNITAVPEASSFVFFSLLSLGAAGFRSRRCKRLR